MRRVPVRREGWRSAPMSQSPSVEETVLVVTDHLIRRTVVENRELLDLLDDFDDAAQPFLRIPAPRLFPLAVNFPAQNFGQRARNGLPAPPRQLAGEPLGLRILDVQGHGLPPNFFLLPIILPSSLRES